MKVQSIVQTFRSLHALIEAERTGPPDRLGRKLGLKERQVRQYIADLKEMGAEIHYDRRARTYKYKTPVTLIANLKIERQ